jgi:hypothetical protein
VDVCNGHENLLTSTLGKQCLDGLADECAAPDAGLLGLLADGSVEIDRQLDRRLDHRLRVSRRRQTRRWLTVLYQSS